MNAHQRRKYTRRHLGHWHKPSRFYCTSVSCPPPDPNAPVHYWEPEPPSPVCISGLAAQAIDATRQRGDVVDVRAIINQDARKHWGLS